MLAELLCSVDISADYKNISGNCNCKLMNAAEVLGHSGPWFLAGGLSSRLLHRVTRANTTNTITQEDSITQANTITPSNTIKWLKTITPINTIIQAKGQPPRPNRLFFLIFFKLCSYHRFSSEICNKMRDEFTWLLHRRSSTRLKR